MSTLETPPASAPTPAPLKQPRPARIGRFTIGLNVVVQLLVIFAIIVFINYFGFRHFKRWDFSRDQKFALSPQTKAVLAHLDAPVRAIVFFPQAQSISHDVATLLREYEYTSDRKFAVEQVDPYRNLIRARELAEKYKFGASDNIVILDYKGKSKFVNAQDMVEADNSGAMFGQPPTIKGFKGEEAITSALLELTEEKQNKLYLVGGHAELEQNSPQISGFKEYLVRQNIKSDSVNLNNVDVVPADATGLLIFGPKTDYSERELKLLADFWNEKRGRLFVLLSPTSKTPRLNEFLASQGVTPQNDRVLKTATVMALDENNRPAFKNGVVTSPGAVITASGKAINKELAGVDTQLLGATESLALDPAKTQTDKIRYTPILEAGEGYWGSTTYVTGETRQVFFDPKKDHQGPLVLGAAVEKGGLADPRVKVETARMIVIGNSGFLTDEGLQLSDVGADFALNAVNWMFNREAVAGISAKPKAPMKLSLDEKKMNTLALVIILGVPCLSAILGLIVVSRRHA